MDGQASYVAAATAAERGSKEHVQNNISGRSLLPAFKESPRRTIKSFLIGGMITWPIEVWMFEHAEGLMSKVPYTANFGIIACSLAWKWKAASVSAFRTQAFLSVVYTLLLFYICHRSPGFVTQARAPTFFLAIIWLFFDLLVWTASCLIASRLQRLAHSQNWQDEEKHGGEAESQNKGNGKSGTVAPGSEYRAHDRSMRLKVSVRKLTLASSLAFALLVLIDIATLVSYPPTALSNYLATTGCSVRFEDLHNDRALLQFTAQARSSSTIAAPSCSFDRKMSVLTREMNKHAMEVIPEDSAGAAMTPDSCAVYCFLKGNDGELIGRISQTIHVESSGFPDMSFCRDPHGFYGNCKAVGEKHGYNTTNEGWLNDVHG